MVSAYLLQPHPLPLGAMVGGPKIRWCYGGGGGMRNLINHTQVFNPNKPVSVFFDVCEAIGQDGGDVEA
jgi:hypothetical protein